VAPKRVDIILDPGEAEGSEFSVSYWKVDAGARVETGNEIVVLESVDDKTALVVLSPHSGKLVEILVLEEQVVSVGEALGRIEVD
jgi:pyruvate/2-oxoglutarate dehydrogenase complex dihydrolipoamide acyltransferase (E2) component